MRLSPALPLTFLIVLPFLACNAGDLQESYSLGAQVSASPSESESPSPTLSPSVSPTASPIISPSPILTPSPTASPDTDEGEPDLSTLEANAEGVNQLFNQLNAKAAGATGQGDSTQQQAPTNWLGKAFQPNDPIEGVSLDSDRDGFTDALETFIGTDKDDPNSHPMPVTRLSERTSAIDTDQDGVSNKEEIARGLDPNNPDSDNDGAMDGTELLSDSDPLSTASKPVDHDGDQLGSDFETKHGINFQNPDTDGDGLNDARELALGTNANDTDSDNDGILDGKEVELGSDPLLSEFSQAR